MSPKDEVNVSAPSDNAVTQPIAKLSKRLAAIERSVGQGYDHIWDCCCDHGLLGAQLLRRGAAPNIHFVDIVDSIIEQLESRLADVDRPKSINHFLYCQDVATLPLGDFDSNDKHLIILAGVGGELTLSIIEQLVDRFPAIELEFLLCPLRHQFSLRSQLQAKGLSLLGEHLMREDKWFYEIIHLGTGPGDDIVDVGSKMWRRANVMHLDYIKQLLGHYQRMAKSPACNVDNEINRYQQLLRHLEQIVLA